MKLIIVTPWFSEKLNGGCEKVAVQLASRLSKTHSVTVFATCSPSLRDHWGKHEQPRLETKENYQVQFFECGPARRENFAEATQSITAATQFNPGISPVGPPVEALFWANNISSPALLERLSKSDCDRIILLPYLFGVVNDALVSPELEHLRSKMFLMPCLHDESFAYLRRVEVAIHNAGGLLLLSAGEMAVAQQLYGPGVTHKAAVVGSGIEPGRAGKNKLKYPYFLCIGIRAGKGAELLIEAFRLYKSRYPHSPEKLVLVGQSDVDFSAPDIVQLKEITEQYKATLLKHCLALASPSKSESYSRAMHEAWHQGRPVIVRGDCSATAQAVADSGGGWTAIAIEDWAEKLADIAQASPEELATVGSKGKRYGATWANWGKAISRINKAIALPAPQPLTKRPIHQLLAGLTAGDAISNHALTLRQQLRAKGHPSEIYAEHCDHPLAHPLADFPRNCELIYHHHIGTSAADVAIAHTGKKRLIYHNITPAHFFERSQVQATMALIRACAQLKQLVNCGFHSIQADSEYNAKDLWKLGAQGIKIEPLPTPASRWDVAPDWELMEKLQGTTNLLFVGRIVENKCQHDLIETFQYFCAQNPTMQDCKLLLVGGGDPASEYHQRVRQLASNVPGVEMLGKLSEAGLAACYRSASLYLSLSEHEGFGVPLIEAKQHGIPMIAYDCSAVSETIGDYAVLIDGKDPKLIAGLCWALLELQAEAEPIAA